MKLALLIVPAASCFCVGHTQAFSTLPIVHPPIRRHTSNTNRRTSYLQSSNKTDNDSMNSNSHAIVTASSQNELSYPVEIHHQGHKATIHVRPNEPILHALERQSSSSSDNEVTALGLSNIPHECRRGNCLTCASKLLSSGNNNSNNNNDTIQPNINTGLTPAIDAELTKHNYILTCCSYITGEGVVLELEQNESVWDRVYRDRFDDIGQLGREMGARMQRRVDEGNVGRWREKMEKLFDDGD